MKRLVFIILLVAAICSIAQAKYSGGSGTAGDPYKIGSAADLNDIGNHTEDFNKCFLMTADINLSAYTGTQYNIIGNYSTTKFTGAFDGDGHVIRNLTYTTTARTSYIGLFGYTDNGAVIKNLGLENVSITCGNGSWYLGGLVGSGGGSISNCYSTGVVTGGYNSASECLGGLMGSSIASINNCYSTVTVSGVALIGGLVGFNCANISNCYSTGATDEIALSGGSYMGGLVGENQFGSISNCYSTGSVTSEYGSGILGGLVGGNEYGSINNSYFLDTSGPDNLLGIPLTDAQMKQQNNFVGWDFTNETANGTNDYWRMCVNGVNYPQLNWQYAQYGDFICPDGVNFADYSFFAERWLNTDCASSNNCDGADLDLSGTVDMADLAIMCDYWLKGF